MSIHSTSNNPIRLSGDNALTKEGAQNISKALTPFAHDYGVSKSISKLDTIQPRDVTAIDTSGAKSFFSSLSQAICDVCHNIRAFFSQSDETILGIGRPTENLLKTLRQHKEEIENLFANASSSEDAKNLRNACNMLQKTHNELEEKLNNGNRHDYNLAGDGRQVLEEILDDIKKVLAILQPNWKECGRHAVRQFGNDVRQGLQKAKNFAGNLVENIGIETEKKVNEIGKNIDQIGKSTKKRFNNFTEVIKKLAQDKNRPNS